MASEKSTGVPIIRGWESDALTGWRRFIRFRPGARKAAKRSFNRRVRRRPIETDWEGGLDDDEPSDAIRAGDGASRDS